MKQKILNNILIMLCTVLILTSFTSAATWNNQEYESKNSPPSEIIDTVRELIIEKGISEEYFDEHFSLKLANVDSGGAEWESASINWEFKINEEYTVDYRVSAYKVDESFIITEDYEIKNRVAYSFDTKKLHEFGELISKIEAKEKLEECLGFKPNLGNPTFDVDGNLFLSEEKPLEEEFGLVGQVNLETGELKCSEFSYQLDNGSETGGETKDFTYIFVIILIVLIVLIILFLKFRKK